MRAIIGMALALAMAGCVPAEPVPPTPQHPGHMPYHPPPYGPDANRPDNCGAPEMQWLVGRDRSQIPPAPPNRARRVFGRGDPITMDFSPERQNIEYDRSTGRVLRVFCG